MVRAKKEHCGRKTLRAKHDFCARQCISKFETKHRKQSSLCFRRRIRESETAQNSLSAPYFWWTRRPVLAKTSAPLLLSSCWSRDACVRLTNAKASYKQALRHQDDRSFSITSDRTHATVAAASFKSVTFEDITELIGYCILVGLLLYRCRVLYTSSVGGMRCRQ